MGTGIKTDRIFKDWSFTLLRRYKRNVIVIKASRGPKF